MKTKFRLMKGKIRRMGLIKIYPKYVKNQIDKRKGFCAQCGSCCKLGLHCPFHMRNDLCRVYFSWFRPDSCIEFPIDERDIKDIALASGNKCSYYW